MKVILIKDLTKKGKINEIIDVKSGYAVNHLFPNKIAIAYNEKNKAMVKEIVAKNEEIKQITIAKLKKIKKAIEKENLVFKLKFNNEKVFGSITNKQICDKLKEKVKHNISAQKIVEHEPLKLFGKSLKHIKLSSEIIAEINIEIKKENA